MNHNMKKAAQLPPLYQHLLKFTDFSIICTLVFNLLVKCERMTVDAVSLSPIFSEMTAQLRSFNNNFNGFCLVTYSRSRSGSKDQ